MSFSVEAIAYSPIGSATIEPNRFQPPTALFRAFKQAGNRSLEQASL